MSTKTLSDLTAAVTPASADILHIRQTLTDKSITLNLIAQYVLQSSAFADTKQTVNTSSDLSALTVNSQIVVDVSGGNIILGLQNGATIAGIVVLVTAKGATNTAFIKFATATYHLPLKGGNTLGLMWNGTTWIVLFCNVSPISYSLASANQVITLPDTAVDGSEMIIAWTDGAAGTYNLTLSSGYTVGGVAVASFFETGAGSVHLRLNRVTSDWEIINRKSFPAIKIISSADYAILDYDGYQQIQVTTAAADRTITLPTLADNQGRVLTIKKIDTGAGKVIIDGESSETLDGETSISLYSKLDAITFIASSDEWKVLSLRRRYDGLNYQYIAGNTYNGVALNVTAINGTLVRGIFIPYLMLDGTWRLKFNFHMTFSPATGSGTIFTIAGVVFKNTSNYYQACSCETASNTQNSGFCTPNTGELSGQTSGAGSAAMGLSGDLELESKPTWLD